MSGHKVVIIDYGVGNLFNIQRAFEAVGVDSEITNKKEVILGSAKLFLPGVGAYEAGMDSLKKAALVDTVREYAKSGKKLMGICLGMQLLLSESEENGKWPGLNIVPGKVTKFRSPEAGGENFKIPQIGWNEIRPSQKEKKDAWKGTILDGIEPGAYMYFIHSYHVVPNDTAVRLADTEYGLDRICAVLQKDNISGCQFHPERSSDAGLKILKNFALMD